MNVRNAVPAELGSREVVVVPLETENDLYYEDWVQATTAKVDKATGGLVGYIHPAREFAGIDDQLNKAIEVVLAELKAKGQDIPPLPAFPKKNP
jgi:hypothetical protein